MKINMTYLEWYKEVSMSCSGYCDVFKNVQSTRREEIVNTNIMFSIVDAITFIWLNLYEFSVTLVIRFLLIYAKLRAI